MRTTYHNDRTQSQAKAIVDNLVIAGIKSDNLIISTNAIPAVLPENRKLVIKAVARSKTGQ